MLDASGAPARGGPEAQPQLDANQRVDNVKPIERLRRVFTYARPYRGRLAIALVCLFVASGLGLVHPYFFGELAGAAFTSGSASDHEKAYHALGTNSVALVLVFLAQAVFIFFRHYYMTWIGERVVTDLRIDLYRHLATMPQSYFHSTRTGELLSRLADDVTRLQNTVGQDLSIFLRNVIMLIGGVAVLFYMNWLLTAAMLAVVPALMIAANDLAVPDLKAVGATKPVALTISARLCTPDRVTDLKQVLSRHPGPADVHVTLVSEQRSTVLRLNESLRVTPSSALMGDLKALLGPACLGA